MVRMLSGVLIVVPKQADLVDSARDAGRGDEVAHLERPQNHQEGASREVGEQSAPCHADRNAAGCDESGERRRLNAEVAEDRDDQGDVEQDGNPRLHVARERGVEVVPLQRATQQTERESDQVAADQPEGQRAGDLPCDGDEGGDGVLREGIEVHGDLPGGDPT